MASGNPRGFSILYIRTGFPPRPPGRTALAMRPRKTCTMRKLHSPYSGRNASPAACNTPRGTSHFTVLLAGFNVNGASQYMSDRRGLCGPKEPEGHFPWAAYRLTTGLVRRSSGGSAEPSRIFRSGGTCNGAPGCENPRQQKA